MRHILTIVCSTFLLLSASASAEEGAAAKGKSQRAIFAGGCFWCMEQPFDELAGVLETTVGYIGGSKQNAEYKKVSSGGTNHTEAIEIRFDPNKVSYEKLLRVFWLNIDPTQKDGQFCDWGRQYRTGVYYLDEEQKRQALASREWAKKRIAEKGEFQTEILPSKTFYKAEGYHQNYYKTNSLSYKSYRVGCGRDRRLSNLWGR